MSRFVKLSVVAALLSSAGLAAHAQSSVKVYGLVDLNVGQFQSAGGTKTRQVSNGDFSTSFLGFGGKEDLGGGLYASFALESFLRPDTGRAGRVSADTATNSDVFWARAANLTLGGEFGSVKLGRQTTTLFISTLIFNPFGDSFGFSPSIRQYYTAALIGDSGWSNALSYTTPNFSGFSATVQGSLGEGAAKSVGKNVGGNLLYFSGPFAATAAYQRVKSDYDFRFGSTLPAGFRDQSAYQLGASYDLGVAKLFGQYGSVTTDIAIDIKTKIYQVGASVPLGGGKFLASYGEAKYSGRPVGQPTGYIFGRNVGTSKVTTLGYDYNLSKRTDVYAVFVNDKYTALKQGNTFAVGVRHAF
jgi:predicted porin